MPAILIDGYNLIGTAIGDLAAGRERLAAKLIAYNKDRGHSITVVFDGWKDGAGPETAAMRGGIRIIYSGIGERADDVIGRILSKERREWIVVSSDREVAARAWAAGSVPVPSGEFLRIIERPGGSVSCASEEKSEDEETFTRQKGRARQLSRREKAIERALARLS